MLNDPKIGCKMKNAFAIDNEGNLYSWGAHATNLNIISSASDILFPTKSTIFHNNVKYCVKSISCAQFHAGIIADRSTNKEKGEGASVKRFAFSEDLLNCFKKLFENFKNALVDQNRIKKVITFLLKTDIKTTTVIKFSYFEKYFLKSFYNYQNLQKRNIIKMNVIYENFLRKKFSVNKKNEFEVDALDQIEHTDLFEFRELKTFLVDEIITHLNSFPDDLEYFLKLLLAFKVNVNYEDVEVFFSYLNNGNLNNKNYCEMIFNELKSSNDACYISTDDFVENIMGEFTGKGKVFTWGVKENGRLGISSSDTDSEEYQMTPHIVYFPSNAKIIKVACGFSHTLCLDKLGLVYSFGNGKDGCLGLNSKEDSLTPTLITKDIQDNEFLFITDICAGMYFSMTLNSKGEVFTFGCCSNGRLGHGSCLDNILLPKKIEYFSDKVIKIASGDTHSAAITSLKEVYTWGNAIYGKLGLGDFNDRHSPSVLDFFIKYDFIPEKVFCGSYCTSVVTNDNKIFAWGKNSHGMLAIPNSTDKNISLPAEVSFSVNMGDVISEIALGSMYFMILLSNGHLYTCGNPSSGIAGLKNSSRGVPQRIPDNVFYIDENVNKEDDIIVNLFNKTLFQKYERNFTIEIDDSKDKANQVVFVDCNQKNTALVTKEGDLYIFGDEKLICETKENKNNLVKKIKIISPSSSISEKVIYIAIGNHHAIVITDQCKVYSWGSAKWGKLGNERFQSNDNLDSDFIVKTPNIIENIPLCRMVAVSDSHSLLLTLKGEIYAFGLNLYGKLGIGSNDHKLTVHQPKALKGIQNATYISCSNIHSACIIKSENETLDIFTWGNANGGKLGHCGFNSDITEPKKVHIENHNNKTQSISFAKLSLGEEFTLALDSNGKIWGCGNKKMMGVATDINEQNSTNSDGQEFYTSPQILSNRIFSYIHSNGVFSFAIEKNGNLFGFGCAIINKITKFFNIENQIDTKGVKFKIAACGLNHFAGIDEEGNAYSWGDNQYYRCGINSNNKVIDKPQKIEFDVADEHSEFHLLEENPISNKDEIKPIYKKTNSNFNNEVNSLQMQIKDEKTEFKNEGLIKEDNRIHIVFNEAINHLFLTLKNLEEIRIKDRYETENIIISKINKTSCKKIVNFPNSKNLPKKIVKNIQTYQRFFELLQTHPCYFSKLFCWDKDDSNNNFITDYLKFLKIVYNVTHFNKKVLRVLIGIWNTILQNEKNKKRNLTESSYAYKVYEQIFLSNFEIDDLIYQIFSEIILVLVREVLESNKIDIEELLPINNDMDNCSDTCNMENFLIISRRVIFPLINKDSKLLKRIIKLLIDKITTLFLDTKKVTLGRYFLLYVFKKLLCRIYKYNCNDNNQISKLFTLFFFTPILKKFKRFYNGEETPALFIKSVIETSKNRKEYSQLYNLLFTLFSNKKLNTEELFTFFFSQIIKAKSELLKFIIDLLDIILDSGGNIKEASDTNLSTEESDYNSKLDFTTEINEMTLLIKESLMKFEHDFSTSFLMDLINNNLEQLNNLANFIPIKIEDLLEIQSIFSKMMKEKLIAEEDPLYKVMTELENIHAGIINTEKIDLKYIINIELNTQTFPFNNLTSDFLIFKCPDCKLALPEAFFTKDQVSSVFENEINSPWICDMKTCRNHNSAVDFKCVSCNSIRNVKRNKFTFFRKFFLPHNDYLTILLEEVLYNLPLLNKNADVLHQIKKEIEELENPSVRKGDEKTLCILYNKFLFNFKLECENMQTKDTSDLLDLLWLNIEDNIKSRISHAAYTQKISELLNFIYASAEKAKNNYYNLREKLCKYKLNAIVGYSDTFFKYYAPGSIINKEHQLIDKYDTIRKFDMTPKFFDMKFKHSQDLIKMFSLRNLIKNKIIEDITKDNEKYWKFLNKIKVIIEQDEYGFSFKLLLREGNNFGCRSVNQKYILNEFSIKKELIVNLRKVAVYNPTVTIAELKFNVFYLIKLLNSFE